MNEDIMKTGNHDNSANPLSSFRILRGVDYGADPCSAIQKLAAQNYGSSTALPESILQVWYDKNPAIFRIAVTPENAVAGYLSSLPLITNMFNRTTDSDFNETSITADDIHTGFYPAKGGIFISSIVVGRDYQEHTPVSLLLRLTLVEDLIGQWPGDEHTVRMSAQTLSPRGEACMQSLGLQEQGLMNLGWKVYYGRLGKTDLHAIQRELQRKFESRFKPAEYK